MTDENLLQRYQDKLDELKAKSNLRAFHPVRHDGRYIKLGGDNARALINLASNDYLGLASDADLQAQFLDKWHSGSYGELPMSSSSSRLLSGNFSVYEALENRMAQMFHGRACLLFNSGYHANLGILPAISDSSTVILADKLVHASMIDGIRLSTANGAKCVRYAHQNLAQLDKLLQRYQDDGGCQQIIVITESIFSMDGDVTDLAALARLKKKYPKTLLYVDEAHAIGVRGEQGLGCAEEFGLIDEIDFIVGAFGKAMASVGGYLICHPVLRDYLINHMRPLIFSTALPPINIAWTHHIFNQIITMSSQRRRLHELSSALISQVRSLGLSCPSASQIVPVILGDNQAVMDAAASLKSAGFYILGVRPPTVPQGQSRLRICLHAGLQDDEFERLCARLNTLSSLSGIDA